jgi:hypothetical protein
MGNSPTEYFALFTKLALRSLLWCGERTRPMLMHELAPCEGDQVTSPRSSSSPRHAGILFCLSFVKGVLHDGLLCFW